MALVSASTKSLEREGWRDGEGDRGVHINSLITILQPTPTRPDLLQDWHFQGEWSMTYLPSIEPCPLEITTTHYCYLGVQLLEQKLLREKSTSKAQDLSIPHCFRNFQIIPGLDPRP